MNSNRIKLLAATVGAGAAIAGATIAVGAASADDQPFVGNEPLTTTETTVPGAETPEVVAPEAGESIDAVTTTPTTSEAGPPPAAG